MCVLISSNYVILVMGVAVGILTHFIIKIKHLIHEMYILYKYYWDYEWNKNYYRSKNLLLSYYLL